MLLMAEATDGREAADAVKRSQERLQRVRARQSTVSRIAARLRPHLEVNHFGERIDAAYRQQRREDPA